MELRDEEIALVEVERLAQRLHGALVGGHAADEGDRRLDDLALGDRSLEVADDGVTEPAQYLGRLVALLLGVDHVALREHAAAAGDARRLAGIEHNVADVLDVVQQATRLLVHERARAGGAIAIGLVVDDAGAPALINGLETDELRGLAAHLEDRVRIGVQSGDAPGDGLELVLEPGVERLADETPAGTCDAHTGQLAGRQHREELVDEGTRGLARTALDAAVPCDQQRSPIDHGQAPLGDHEEIRMLGQQPSVEGRVVGLAGEGRLEADAADVKTERRHDSLWWRMADTSVGTRIAPAVDARVVARVPITGTRLLMSAFAVKRRKKSSAIVHQRLRRASPARRSVSLSSAPHLP